MLEVLLPLAIGLMSAVVVVGARAIGNRLRADRPMRRSYDSTSAYRAAPAQPFEPRPIPSARPAPATPARGQRSGRLVVTWAAMLGLVAAAVTVAAVLILQGGGRVGVAPATDLPTGSPSASATIPSGTGSASVTPSPAPTGAPALVRSSIAAALDMNAGFLTARSAIAAELAQPAPRAAVIAGHMRDIGADAARGADLVPAISAWPPASAHASELTTTYAAIRTAARDALEASVSNADAYRASGAGMVDMLGGVASLDGQTRELAAAAGVPVASAPPAAAVP